jgi:hypothetical protein
LLIEYRGPETRRAEREFLDTEKAEKKRNKRQAGL